MSTSPPHPSSEPPRPANRETDHLPDVYVSFRQRYPDAAVALDSLAAAVDASGPLDARTQRLVKLGIAVGAVSKGAVRSNARKALAEGATPEEIRQVAVLAVTTAGFPTAVASYAWIDEVLEADS